MKRQFLVATLALTLTSPLALAQTQSGTGASSGAMSSGSSGTMSSGSSGSMGSGSSMQSGMSGSSGMTMDVTTAADFVPMAAQSNMLEIQMAKVALKKSQNKDVRQFANMMVKDHTKAGKDLKAAVQKSGSKMTVPAKLDAAHQQMLDQLQQASGSDFDTLYIDMNVQAHEQAVGLFQGYSQKGKTGPVKTFATKTLPTLKQHLQMVQKMNQA